MHCFLLLPVAGVFGQHVSGSIPSLTLLPISCHTWPAFRALHLPHTVHLPRQPSVTHHHTKSRNYHLHTFPATSTPTRSTAMHAPTTPPHRPPSIHSTIHRHHTPSLPYTPLRIAPLNITTHHTYSQSPLQPQQSYATQLHTHIPLFTTHHTRTPYSSSHRQLPHNSTTNHHYASHHTAHHITRQALHSTAEHHHTPPNPFPIPPNPPPIPSYPFHHKHLSQHTT